jgi:hypothetical protein
VSRQFTRTDEGKQVVTTDGTPVGSIVATREGAAYVAPIRGLLRGYGSWVTGTYDGDVYRLDEREVRRVDEHEVVVGVDHATSPRRRSKR